jgi:hypothetical protein
MGDYDIVAIFEAPDDAVAARFSLQLGKRPDAHAESVSRSSLSGNHQLARLVGSRCAHDQPRAPHIWFCEKDPAGRLNHLTIGEIVTAICASVFLGHDRRDWRTQLVPVRLAAQAMTDLPEHRSRGVLALQSPTGSSGYGFPRPDIRSAPAAALDPPSR